MKKKKHSSTPRRKRLNRKQRLTKAKSWIPTYDGKNIVRGYAKWFGVDLRCAITELRLVGETVSADYEEQVKRAIQDRSNQRKIREAKATAMEKSRFIEHEYTSPWDDEFEFVAGYTSAGFPYGIKKGESSEKFSPEMPYICASIDELEFIAGYTSDGMPYGIRKEE